MKERARFCGGNQPPPRAVGWALHYGFHMGEDNDDAADSHKLISTAVPMLAAGTVFVALSTTFADGARQTFMLVAGAILLLFGAIMLTRGLQLKKPDQKQQ